ncbi:MAG: heme-binding domain-containing protein [Bacteroidales bacterium]
MKKRIIKVIIVIVVIFIVIQFIPTHFNPPSFNTNQDFIKTENIPDSVSTLFKNACYDCHSFETKFPWYASVAPVSWFLKMHIKDGRSNVNFSEWTTYDKTKKITIIGEIIEEVLAKEMPLKSYTWMHPAARLTEEQRQIIVSWSTMEEQRISKTK